MKGAFLPLAAAALSLAAVPVSAQQTPGPGNTLGPMYYGHMWGWGGGGWGWHPGAFLFPFVMLLALVGTVALILWLVRWAGHGPYHAHPCPYCGRSWRRDESARGALDILAERLARGEIGKEEFEEKRKLLGR